MRIKGFLGNLRRRTEGSLIALQKSLRRAASRARR